MSLSYCGGAKFEAVLSLLLVIVIKSGFAARPTRPTAVIPFSLASAQQQWGVQDWQMATATSH